MCVCVCACACACVYLYIYIYIYIYWLTETCHSICILLLVWLLLPSFNHLGARVFWKKCWILTSRFQKLVAWKGLKIKIYCKLEKCWPGPKVYVGSKYTNLICISWRHHGAYYEFHNIQEKVDIELMFELICMFVCFLSFYPHYKLLEKRKPTIKQEKVQNYYYITILYSSKTHVTSSLLFDQFISNIQEIIDIEWLF